MNDFEEFARQFRQRTAARMLEFEKNLQKVQEDVENNVARSAARKGERGRRHPQHARRHTDARVKGVLRRD
ncbi:hypothetical protein C3B44_02170 [Corynebacterium yudongzhengii]|uniref:Uncharacterized protein n=1 Tax=Corynebacterium yudongzhengii TaxID=2080740 RepID=A0A2U1T6U9_9CORY|nr:hypothetical protein [Corynebacterium yudongzhengii]AWB81298.1 hypothetical protein C3B44_02170 [Corynebacterium yudongzhengii]PWC01741.1 hypothetical protein DF222_05255 [Corynebacterium yudongzhengii]